jgi:hypothetical protein
MARRHAAALVVATFLLSALSFAAGTEVASVQQDERSINMETGFLSVRMKFTSFRIKFDGPVYFKSETEKVWLCLSRFGVKHLVSPGWCSLQSRRIVSRMPT